MISRLQKRVIVNPSEWTPKRWVRNKKNSPQYLDALAATALDELRSDLEKALDTLQRINARLAEIDEAIRSLQPKRHGAIVMERYGCEGHGVLGCVGCPHVRWVQWLDLSRQEENHKPKARQYRDEAPEQRPGLARKTWNAYLREHPLRYLRRTGPFEAIHRDIETLIKEAQTLLQEKSKLLNSIGNFRRSFRQMKFSQP